jgi:hypothetical protein
VTARWRRGRIGIELVVDDEVSVIVAQNGAEWRAWGDVQYSSRDRERVIAQVLLVCSEAGIRVENAPPEE